MQFEDDALHSADRVGPRWLVAFLERIRVRPGAWLGGNNVFSLYRYINAYTQAREDLGYQPYGPGEETLLSDFNEWLTQKFSYTKHPTTWATQIYWTDESARNIFTFFKLWDEFVIANPEKFYGARSSGTSQAMPNHER